MNFPFHKSVLCAIHGIAHCLKQERNMRIHTVAALYVLFFSVFFRFTPAEYGVLILTIGSVLSAELFNTAAEDLCDFVSPGFAERIGSVKDLAAGAVLVCALAALGVGAALFWRPEQIAELGAWLLGQPWRLPILLLSLVPAIGFIVLPGRGGKDGKRPLRPR
ncbi:MAG: diacylglycerol kinase family protein [Clostridiales bacterium]|nr:diacylglycerol kinase family protein [Clostridiales bacterium]